jgi:beta-N-acetylhexosaminidase
VACCAAIGSDETLVMIDQEGGRVQRLKPPVWRQQPATAAYGDLLEKAPDTALRFAGLIARLAADELAGLGVNMNCAPVLDVPVAGSHGVIGDRAYAMAPDAVARLGRAVMAGYAAGGIAPVIKHIPGHGRAGADSHLELPRVNATRSMLEASDFLPFRRLADAPAAMTAHVVYDALDPERAASISPAVIGGLIRGDLGFDGLLMSDDIGMQALSGSLAARARGVIDAGCDLALQCSGRLAEMREAAAAVPELSETGAARVARCLAIRRAATAFDRDEAEQALAEMQAAAAGPAGHVPSASSPVESV